MIRSIAFAFSLTLPVFLLQTVSAQCSQWDVQKFTIQQEQTAVTFDLAQNGSLLAGRASYIVKGKETDLGIAQLGGDAFFRKGDVDGSAKGNVFSVKVYWDGNHKIGVYNGTISSTGRIEGDVYGEENPNVKVRWYSQERVGCLAAPRRRMFDPVPPAATTAPPAAKPAKTIKATGHAKIPAQPVEAPSQSAANPTSETAPMIKANSNDVLVKPPNTSAKITLTWDGGKDHPYAEVWVKVDDADATFVIEQGTGSRLMKVEQGKTYTYILTDSGKNLATFTVKVR